MAEEKKCFVIMPITTPTPMVDKYHDGKDHFLHVYHCLFEPSIRKAGYTPLPPKAEGSDLIHAGIIGNLESADLVLCDMSCLNPNVFFEWGIRTALNKPVCVVKDEWATNVPFDTTMLNYHQYTSALNGWEIEVERERLTAHLTASATKAGNENALWKYFGLSSKGQPYQAREGSDGKLDYIAMQMESIVKRIDGMMDRKHVAPDMFADAMISSKGLQPPPMYDIRTHLNHHFGAEELGEFRVSVGTVLGSPFRIYIQPNPAWSDDMTRRIVQETEKEFHLPVVLGEDGPVVSDG